MHLFFKKYTSLTVVYILTDHSGRFSKKQIWEQTILKNLRSVHLLVKGSAAASAVQEEQGGSQAERGVGEPAEGAEGVSSAGEGAAAQQTQVRQSAQTVEIKVTLKWALEKWFSHCDV